MERILTYLISEKEKDQTVYQFLKSHDFSSKNIIELKKMPNSILVNDIWVHVTYVLKESDKLVIHITESNYSQGIVPVPWLDLSYISENPNAIPSFILYEDEDILVINKPANMPIHPSINNYENSLANHILYYYREKQIPFTFRCVNRLDRDTSGLTIIAKHMLSSSILSSMVANKELKREYLAIATGHFAEKKGTINAPIGRTHDSIMERMVDETNGEHAITHYQVMQEFTYQNTELSLLSLVLETGRTHQIRVHLKHLGHPLIGDFLYNPDMRFINRQALHSHKLSFLHPITKKAMEFHAPLPSDMTFFI